MPTVRSCEIVTRLCDDEGNNIFSLEELQEILKEKPHVIDKWAYIIHDKDVYTEDDEKRNPEHKQDTLKPEHIHLLLHFDRRHPQKTENIAKWFKLKHNFVSKIHGKWKNAVCYLVHRNSPEKYQYPIIQVVSNFNVETIIEHSEDESKFEEILQRILSGEIREYNKTLEIDNMLLVTPSTAHRIDLAFKTRQELLQATQKERNTVVIYICGKSGAGKTTLAKKIAEENQLDYFISSGSNDVMDGYCQQPVLICDDIRPSCMGLSDLLKLLDPHTASSVKSRYKNKYLNAKMIILTSVLPIDEFYHNVFEHENEPITQLKRRCNMYIKMDMATISVRRWDNYNMCYSTPEKYPNLVLLPFQAEQIADTRTTREYIEEIIPFLKNNGEPTISESEKTEKPKNQNTEKSENPNYSNTKEDDNSFKKLLFGEE